MDRNTPKPPQLTIWCAEPDMCQPILSVLSDVADVTVAKQLPDAATLADPAAQSEVLLFCAPPLTRLYRAMRDGTAPGDALADWQCETRRVLELNRRNRRRVRIINPESAQADMPALLDHFGLTANPETVPDAQPQHMDETLLTLLAQSALLRDRSVQTLVSELDAATLDLSEDPDAQAQADHTDAAFAAYRKLNRDREQLKLFKAQGQAIQAELSAVEAARSDLDRQLSDKTDEAEQYKAQAQLLTAQTAALSTEMTAEQARSQDEIQSLHAKLTESETARDTLQQDLDNATKAQTQSRAEIELLLAQNMASQTELEGLELARQRLDQRIEQLSQGMDSYRVQVEQLRAEQEKTATRAAEKEISLDAAGGLIRDLQTQLEMLQQEHDSRTKELNHIRRSRAWRMTAPLRGLKRLITGTPKQ